MVISFGFGVFSDCQWFCCSDVPGREALYNLGIIGRKPTQGVSGRYASNATANNCD